MTYNYKPKRERTPEQIIGRDAIMQLIFEGYEVTTIDYWRPRPKEAAIVKAWKERE